MARLKVRCIDNRPYLKQGADGVFRVSPQEGDMISLTLGRVYEVLDSDGEFYRIVDDTEEDYLYPTAMFELVE